MILSASVIKVSDLMRLANNALGFPGIGEDEWIHRRIMPIEHVTVSAARRERSAGADAAA